MPVTRTDLLEDVKNVLPVANGGAGGDINLQTGTSYTVLSSDNRKLLVLQNGSAVAVSLPDPASVGNLFVLPVTNIGAGTATLTPAAGNIDGASSLALATNQGVTIFSDGSNYYSVRGVGGSGSGGGGSSLVGLVTPATLTPPSLASFTWVNQLSFTAGTNSGGALYIESPQNSSNLSYLLQAAPSTPYTVDIGFIPIALAGGANGGRIYLVAADSSTGKSVDAYHDITGDIGLEQFNASNSYASSYFSRVNYLGPMSWWRMNNDGTNLTYYRSFDGQNWFQIYQLAISSYLTQADVIGFGSRSYASMGGLILHWAVS